MSRFLKRKKKVISLLALIFLFTPYWYITLVIWLMLLLYILMQRLYKHCCLLNAKIINYPNTILSKLHNRIEIKKIHTLIIGDTCVQDIVDKYRLGNTLSIQFPDRSIKASFLIFMHVESILEDKGRLVILHDSKTAHNNITIFDLPYLSYITIKELNMDTARYRRARYPLLYEPVASVKYLLSSRKDNYVESNCPIEELRHFCQERNIELISLQRN